MWNPKQSRNKTPRAKGAEQVHIDLSYNPFNMPPDSELLARRDKEVEKQKRIKTAKARMNLQERNCPTLPNLNPSPSKVYQSTSTLIDRSDYIPPVGPEYQCREELHEFIDQKREIFLVQLLIDRKKKEIERINQQQKSENKSIDDQNGKMAETTNQYKMTMSQLEGGLVRGRKAMDIAVKRRLELQSELKKKQANVQEIKAQITLNEEQVEQFRNYDDFLKKISPDSKKELLYDNPVALLDELERIERENLLLIQRCGDYNYAREGVISYINDSYHLTVQEIANIKKAKDEIPDIKVEDQTPESISRDAEILDRELTRLAKIVQRTFVGCFSKKSDITTLMMLERLENELEKMYRETEYIAPSFIIEKQNLKAKQRREEQRREKQEKQIREQQKKMEAALERSKKPIKRKTGRPLNCRALPMKVNRKVDKKLVDEEYFENLLFQPDHD